MQETFSRDECDELTKLIQSRVVDFPSSEVSGDTAGKLPCQTNGSDVSLFGASGFKHNQKILENPPYFFSKVNVLSPASSPYKEQTLDSNKAVMEAKKWFEEKKMASNSKYDSQCGPCTLNSNALHYDIEGEQGSPVDIAKSYMQSLPPVRSPLWFKTPLPTGTHHHYKRTSYTMTDHSLSSSKAFKRDHIAIESWDTLDETSNDYLKASQEELAISKPKQIESSEGVSDHNCSNLASKTAKRDLYVGDNCSNGALKLPDEKAEMNNPLEISNVNSSNVVLDPAETINAVYSRNGSSLRSHCPMPEGTMNAMQSTDESPVLYIQPTECIHSGNTISYPVESMNALLLTNGSAIPSIHPPEGPERAHGLDEYLSTERKVNGSFNMLKDAEVVSHTMEQIDGGRTEGISVPDKSPLSASTSVEHDAIPSSEGKILPPENNKSVEPGDAVDATNANDTHTSDLQTIKDGSCQLNLVSDVKVINSISDARSQEGNCQLLNVANGSISEFSGNSSFSKVDTNSDLENLSEETNIIVGSSAQNDTSKKSIKRISTEPQPNMHRPRRKVVATKPRSTRKR